MHGDLWALGEYLGLSLFSMSDIHNSVIVKRFLDSNGEKDFMTPWGLQRKRCCGGKGEGWWSK